MTLGWIFFYISFINGIFLVLFFTMIFVFIIMYKISQKVTKKAKSHALISPGNEK